MCWVDKFKRNLYDTKCVLNVWRKKSKQQMETFALQLYFVPLPSVSRLSVFFLSECSQKVSGDGFREKGCLVPHTKVPIDKIVNLQSNLYYTEQTHCWKHWKALILIPPVPLGPPPLN